jgi:Sodium/hydrogen exchanger family
VAHLRGYPSGDAADILALTSDAGISLRLARVKPVVYTTLDRDGIVARLGADRIHGNIYRAVEAQ